MHSRFRFLDVTLELPSGEAFILNIMKIRFYNYRRFGSIFGIITRQRIK